MLRPPSSRPGLVLVGHGTRSARGLAEFHETARLVAQRLPKVEVRTGFLELADPTINDAVAELAAAGVERIVAVPLLLLAAGHAKDDIPNALAVATKASGWGEIPLAEHLGCHERLLALSAERFEAAARLDPNTSLKDTLCLMVGRGSHDSEALAEMERFVELRRALTPVGQARIAYLAMAEPKLEAMLREIAALRPRRVIVQPHLLFHGELLGRVSALVAEAAARWPEQQWRVAAHLGADPQVAEAVVDRFQCRSQ